MHAVTKRILCAEADDDICSLLSLILKAEGFEVTAIQTIAEAIHLVGKEHFDLLLVGGEFPDGESVDFVRHARSFNANTPIVLISGWTQDEDIEEGLGAGASAYLAMPVENQAVIETVKGLIASSTSKAP
jgi:DNA-binding response OmpR family regulator